MITVLNVITLRRRSLVNIRECSGWNMLEYSSELVDQHIYRYGSSMPDLTNSCYRKLL